MIGEQGESPIEENLIPEPPVPAERGVDLNTELSTEPIIEPSTEATGLEGGDLMPEKGEELPSSVEEPSVEIPPEEASAELPEETPEQAPEAEAEPFDYEARKQEIMDNYTSRMEKFHAIVKERFGDERSNGLKRLERISTIPEGSKMPSTLRPGDIEIAKALEKKKQEVEAEKSEALDNLDKQKAKQEQELRDLAEKDIAGKIKEIEEI